MGRSLQKNILFVLKSLHKFAYKKNVEFADLVKRFPFFKRFSKMLLVAKIGFDTAENGPFKV